MAKIKKAVKKSSKETYVDSMKERSDVERIEAAGEGFLQTFSNETSVKKHAVIGAIIAFGFLLLKHDTYLFLQTIIFTSFVVGFEMINTAVEGVCDMVQPNKDMRVKKIKDTLAGAVFMLVCVFFVVTMIQVIFLR